MKEYKVIFYDENKNIISSHVVECRDNSKAYEWGKLIMLNNKQVTAFMIMPKSQFDKSPKK